MKIRIRRVAIFFGLIASVAVVAGEMVSRFVLGLGDPPISIADREIDYLFAPNQDCRRFGNRIVYNNLSMRCDFCVDETANTNRIIVVGDSVVNGGVLIDQEKLATTLLQRGLHGVQVCNVSAGSWGPGNYAAYFRRHKGLCRGVLIVEVNSHDLWEDDPALSAGINVGKDVALPDHKPISALWEGVRRYFWRRVRMKFGFAVINTKIDVPKWGKDAVCKEAEWNLNQMTWLVGQGFSRKVLVIHRTKHETQTPNAISIGEIRFREWAQEQGVECWLLELDTNTDYLDKIHLSERGHEKFYRLLRKIVEEVRTK